jgi:ATP-binding cassette subfamily F protein 3
MLDEPTNHLDIPSQEILQEVLSDFPGTILLVSHDRYFIDALATQVWALEEETLYVSKGDAPLSAYSVYLAARQARRLARAEQSPRNVEERVAASLLHDETEQKRARARRQRQLAELEAEIEAAESHLAELSAALEEASYAQEVEQIQTLSRDYQAAEADLARLLDQWTAMEAA